MKRRYGLRLSLVLLAAVPLACSSDKESGKPTSNAETPQGDGEGNTMGDDGRDGNGDGDDDNVCLSADVRTTLKQGVTWLVLPYDGGLSHNTEKTFWEIMGDILFGADGALIHLPDTLSVGMVFNRRGPDGACPALIAVDPSVGRPSELQARFPAPPRLDGPFGIGAPYALELIQSHSLTTDPGRGTSIILLRDQSQPEEVCLEDVERFGGQGKDASIEWQATRSLVSQLREKGVKTYVYELETYPDRGEPLTEGHCDYNVEIAKASGNGGPTHFRVGEFDAAQLAAQLRKQLRGSTPCEVALNGEVTAGRECDGKVKLNGKLLDCNKPNGWRLKSPSVIEFVGEACTSIQETPTSEVKADFPCETFVIF